MAYKIKSDGLKEIENGFQLQALLCCVRHASLTSYSSIDVKILCLSFFLLFHRIVNYQLNIVCVT